jgi:hypothetical protein
MDELLAAVFKAGELAFDFVGEIYQKLRSDSDGDE